MEVLGNFNSQPLVFCTQPHCWSFDYETCSSSHNEVARIRSRPPCVRILSCIFYLLIYGTNKPSPLNLRRIRTDIANSSFFLSDGEKRKSSSLERGRADERALAYKKRAKPKTWKMERASFASREMKFVIHGDTLEKN